MRCGCARDEFLLAGTTPRSKPPAEVTAFVLFSALMHARVIDQRSAGVGATVNVELRKPRAVKVARRKVSVAPLAHDVSHLAMSVIIDFTVASVGNSSVPRRIWFFRT